MKKSKPKKVYVTFSTEPETCGLLTEIAKSMGKTQPELIEEICKGFITRTLSIMTEKGFMEESVFEEILEMIYTKEIESADTEPQETQS